MKEIIKAKAATINDILEKYYIPETGEAKLLYEAMNYSVRVGGKRLRPMLMQEVALLYGNEAPGLYDFMAAIEMIHNYSLVHDDLPAMDNDFLRRGKPTTHAVYGEAMGILAGDGLLNRAYEIMADSCVKHKNPETIEAMAILAKAAGSFGMVGGQSVDVQLEKANQDPTLEELEYISINKTSRLITAPMQIGAVLSGAGGEDVKRIEKMGYCLGVAFQIRDDILDIVGQEEIFGKPIGSDERNAKPTFATVLGLEKAEERVVKFTGEAEEILMSLPGDKTFLKDLFEYLTKRDY